MQQELHPGPGLLAAILASIARALVNDPFPPPPEDLEHHTKGLLLVAQELDLVLREVKRDRWRAMRKQSPRLRGDASRLSLKPLTPKT